MRFAVLCFALLLAGCALSKPDPTGPGAQTRPGSSKRVVGGQVSKAGSRTEATLDQSVMGTVVSVNTALRFLVMDFAFRKMPVLEQRLNIYRNGQKVGEVKVTGPGRDMTIAGDITAGEAQVGDEVRED